MKETCICLKGQGRSFPQPTKKVVVPYLVTCRQPGKKKKKVINKLIYIIYERSMGAHQTLPEKILRDSKSHFQWQAIFKPYIFLNNEL